MRIESKSEMYARLARAEAKAGVVRPSDAGFDARLKAIKARLKEQTEAVKSFATAQKRATVSTRTTSMITGRPTAWYRSATEEWRQAVEKLVEQGMDKRRAAAQVEEDMPGLREMMLRESQSKR